MLTRPCAGRHHDPIQTAATCTACWMYCSVLSYRRRCGGDDNVIDGLQPPFKKESTLPVAAPMIASATPKIHLGVCPFEGAITEHATCHCAGRHVRVCLHPKAEHGRCTRGENNGQDPDVASCMTCTLRPTAKAGFAMKTTFGPVGYTFSHYGDLGDVVASLRSVYGLCLKYDRSAEYFLVQQPGPRELMTSARASIILPLLAAQPYISKVAHTKETISIRLDAALRVNGFPQTLLSDYYERWLGEPIPNVTQPWLTAEPNPIAPVIINRTFRYNAAAGFPWKRIVDAVGKHAVFVGLPDEYTRFCNEFGHVPLYAASNLLEVAEVIAGAKLFIGNQSACRNIAEGLKAPVFVEEGVPADTHYERPDAWYGSSLDAWCERIQEIVREGNKQEHSPPVGGQPIRHEILRGPGR